MAAKSIYRKISGRRRGLGGYSQLWLAPDHLLLVESSRFIEQYRRFALADIQAIVITGLPDRTPWQIAAIAISIVWTLALFAVTPLIEKIFFGVTGAVAIAVSIADLARGPRCRCYLHTAVTRELLSPVSRLRLARAFLDRLRPVVESVQGMLAAQDLGALPSGSAAAPAAPELPHAPGYLPEVLFAMFLLNAAFLLLMQFFPNQVENILPTAFFAEFVVLIVALVRRGERDARRFVFVLMFAALPFMFWDAIGLSRSFVRYMAAIMEQSRRGRPTSVSLSDWIAFDRAPALVAAGWRIVAGVAGLVATWIERPVKTT